MKEPETETDLMNACIELISSVLHEIPNIHNLKGKWSLVGTNLTHLQTQLLTTSSNTTSNPLYQHLLHSLSHTLRNALSLANESQSLTPSQGKLKTQSDLHSLLATLHLHITDSHLLQTSPEPTNLITRLQIGSPESKLSALDSLLSLLQSNDDNNISIAVDQGIIPVLLRLLDSSSQMKDKTVAAISIISTMDACNCKNVLLEEGLLLLNHLLRVLDSGSGFAKEKACVALQALSFSKENARAIGSRGGISSLLDICHAGTPCSQAYASGVLRNLAGFVEIKENFVEENAVSVLLGLASSGTASAQENAIRCLSNLVFGEESLKLLVVKEGGVECLKNFWDSGGNLEVAVELLGQLASNQTVAEVLVCDGFVPRVMGVLNCGVMAVRIGAAKAVYALGFCGSSKVTKEMGEFGCVIITALISMLDGKSVEEKEAAAKALSVLVLHGGNRRIFCKDERGIVSAVLLLNPLLKNLDKRYPVSLLASVVTSKRCRKQMVAAGACVYAQKLVEMDVEGSKKLLECLGRGKNKMWGVFSRP